MERPEYLNEVEILESCCKEARAAFQRERTFKESEVQFRYDTVRGMLVMLQNDITGMVNEWRRDAERDMKEQANEELKERVGEIEVEMKPYTEEEIKDLPF